jgi:hypothetical protein
MPPPQHPKIEIYTKYPLFKLLLYNGVTTIHFLIGGIGIMMGYGSWIGPLIGGLYLVFSFAEMYVVMPLKVCPNCVYYGMENGLCISGLNLISRKVAKQGDIKDFPNRAKGILCHNNMYIASLVLPIIVMIPALIINFSWLVLTLLLVVVTLLLFRFFIMFTKIVCLHCAAKNICPNAISMGLGKPNPTSDPT